MFYFSRDDKSVYLTADHFGRGKIFTHSVATPVACSDGPRELTSTGTANSLAALPNGCLLFMRSSYDAPNDVYLLKHSTQSPRAGDVNETRVTNFYRERLDGKTMRGGTDIWWSGGAQPDRKIQGWVLTPPGFQKGEIGKYPAIMMINGKVFLLRSVDITV
jgi:dipeptidyl aminopeptidase/acylaminoacyl peptidase